MRLSRCIGPVVLALLAGACGGKSAPTVTPSAVSQNNPAQSPPPGTSGQPTPLEGNWATPCMPSDLKVDKNFVREQYTFNLDRSFSHLRATYADANCSSAPTASETIYGSFQPGGRVQAKLGRADATRNHFNGTRTDATGIELVINSPAEASGKFYSVFAFIGQSMYFGEGPYDQQPADLGNGYVPVVDVSKEFRRQ